MFDLAEGSLHLADLQERERLELLVGRPPKTELLGEDEDVLAAEADRDVARRRLDVLVESRRRVELLPARWTGRRRSLVVFTSSL